MSILHSVVELLFKSGRLEEGASTVPIVVFAIAAAFMGLMVVFLDLAAFTLKLVDESFLGLGYARDRYAPNLLLLVVWTLASGVGGLLGASLDIFQITRVGCIAAGIAGPLVLPRLKKSFQPVPPIQPEEGGS